MFNINTKKKAAAVAYSPEMPAPVLLASGKGRDAGRILEEAQRAGIAVVEDPGLAALLEAVRPGDYIPPWCWEAVANILAFVIAKEREFIQNE
ncbi:MAG: EscU/YscU/HrcU family type III secretion system export apparatus switch protein [Treponema sp.]|jgi:flagellar biosynthesis protein|nr:EscU/YscU/HrcU family type III secretion system export apparatus switch protein [Treponema sp.]